MLYFLNRTVAVSAMDIEFERIDINPCPISDGNPEPNYFAGTARCKATTMVRIIYNVFILNLLKKISVNIRHI